MGFLLGRRSGVNLEEREWVYLSDLQWNRATTGWIGAAGDFLPRLNTSFNLRPISLNGRVFPKGIGVFPLSEIEYSLDRNYSTFRAQIGINDGVPSGVGSISFLVFLDDVLAYDSGVITGNDAPKSINLTVSDADRLRLVVTNGNDGNDWDYASWGGPRLLAKDKWSFDSFASDIRRIWERRFNSNITRREREKEDLLNVASARLVEVQRAFENENFVSDTSTEAVFDPTSNQLIIANNRVALIYGLGGQRHGLMSVVNLGNKSLLLQDTTGSISIGDNEWINFHENTIESEPGVFKVENVNDVGLGEGKRVTIDLISEESLYPIQVILTLYDDKPYFTYQLSLNTPGSPHIPSFRFFDMKAASRIALGEKGEYLSDYSQIRQGMIVDDSVIRTETIGLGKPIFVWSSDKGQGLIQAIIDSTEYPAYFAAKMDPGHVTANFTLEHYDPRSRAAADEKAVSRRLFAEVTDTTDTRVVFNNYKNVMSVLYPPIEPPDWVKYQWLSWYVNYMDISEEGIKGQIDYIADNLLDLGDWNILIDAGWYIAEGRDGSEWRNVDHEKFPSGLRSLVDYAHQRGLKVVLYFSSPYVDDRTHTGNWLGLKDIVSKYRDWLIPLREDETGSSFVYDYSNPEFRSYLKSVLEDFFNVYDVDGLKLDGMGDAEGAIINQVFRGVFGQNQRSLTQSVQTYEFIFNTAAALNKEVYIESGWLTPVFAHPYSHTFRYGDEFPVFDNRYPFPGLEQHVDYAIIQKTMLGQRPNMGAIYGDANDDLIGLTWLEAAMALGTQVSISLDLPAMSEQTLSDYRARLFHYNAFKGKTQFGSTFYSDTFQTTVEGTTYLGVMNRNSTPKSIEVDFSHLGMEIDSNYIFLDVEQQRFFRSVQSFSVEMEPDSFRLFIIRSRPGIIWTNSSVDVSEEQDGILNMTLQGPGTIQGFLNLYVPEPNQVILDGTDLLKSEMSDLSGLTYQYDSSNQVLSLNYDHLNTHTLVVNW